MLEPRRVTLMSLESHAFADVEIGYGQQIEYPQVSTFLRPLMRYQSTHLLPEMLAWALLCEECDPAIEAIRRRI